MPRFSMRSRFSITVTVAEHRLSTSQPSFFYLLMLVFGSANEFSEIEALQAPHSFIPPTVPPTRSVNLARTSRSASSSASSSTANAPSGSAAKWSRVALSSGRLPRQAEGTLSVPADPDKISSFMNIRVADIQACYKLSKRREAQFITKPKEK